MKVKLFKSFIEKYYLGGIVDTMKFTPEKDKMVVRFISPASNLAGIISSNKIKIDSDKELGIFSTKKLLKMISIFKDEVEMSYKEPKLNMKDGKFDVNFSLCQIDLVKKFPKNISFPERCNFIVEVDKDFPNDFSTASKAIDSTVFKLSCDKDGNLIFILGDVRNAYSDKITLKVKSNEQLSSGEAFDDMIFDVNDVEQILSANKSATTGNISISGEGIMKFYFSNEDYEAVYYLVKNKE